jgi:hypothetical protein
MHTDWTVNDLDGEEETEPVALVRLLVAELGAPEAWAVRLVDLTTRAPASRAGAATPGRAGPPPEPPRAAVRPPAAIGVDRVRIAAVLRWSDAMRMHSAGLRGRHSVFEIWRHVASGARYLVVVRDDQVTVAAGPLNPDDDPRLVVAGRTNQQHNPRALLHIRKTPLEYEREYASVQPGHVAAITDDA